MPPSRISKDAKQFLGLAGYSRKFVLRFADISGPLTTITKVIPFEWMKICHDAFNLLKNEP